MAVELLGESLEVGLVTSAPDAMADFYEGFLGLRAQGVLEFPGGRQRRFALGTTVIKLVEYDDAPATPTTPGGGRGQQGIRYLTLGVTDLRAVAAELALSPYEIVEPLVEFAAVPGFGFLYVADPDGNWVELYGPTNTESKG